MFKREYIGVYFTLTVFGAGAGLLVAAYIDIKRSQSDESSYEETFEARASEETTDAPSEEATGISEPKSSRRVGAKKETPSGTSGEDSGESAVEEWYDSGGDLLTDEEREEYEELRSRYDVNKTQHQLLTSGVISLDELRDALETVKGYYADTDYTEYSSTTQYAIPPEEEERFIVYHTKPSKDDMDGYKIIELIYNPDDDTLFRLTASKQIVPLSEVSASKYIDDDTLTYAVSVMMDNDGGVWVKDVEEGRILVISFSETEAYEDPTKKRPTKAEDVGEY